MTSFPVPRKPFTALCLAVARLSRERPSGLAPVGPGC